MSNREANKANLLCPRMRDWHVVGIVVILLLLDLGGARILAPRNCERKVVELVFHLQGFPRTGGNGVFPGHGWRRGEGFDSNCLWRRGKMPGYIWAGLKWSWALEKKSYLLFCPTRR
jgi:hypothetical protein